MATGILDLDRVVHLEFTDKRKIFGKAKPWQRLLNTQNLKTKMTFLSATN